MKKLEILENFESLKKFEKNWKIRKNLRNSKKFEKFEKIWNIRKETWKLESSVHFDQFWHLGHDICRVTVAPLASLATLLLKNVFSLITGSEKWIQFESRMSLHRFFTIRLCHDRFALLYSQFHTFQRLARIDSSLVRFVMGWKLAIKNWNCATSKNAIWIVQNQNDEFDSSQFAKTRRILQKNLDCSKIAEK